MESQNSWIESLNISSDQLASWQAEAPEDTPLLVWCLMEEKLSFEDYSQWAKNQYEIPVLNSHFFSNLSSTSTNHIDPMDWTPWMVPLAQWEGITYVGCVIPPPDPAEGYVYLLANPKELDRVYMALDHSEAQNPEQEEAQEMHTLPGGLILDLKSPMKEPLLPPVEASEELKEDLSEPDSPSDAPVGLNLNLSSPEPIEPIPVLTEEVSLPQMASPPPKAEPSPQPLPENVLQAWWQNTKESFAHAVLLKVEKELLHTFWKDGKEFSSSEPISMQTPSLFRIVLRTQKPYHGFVVENQIHSQFFEGLGFKTYPGSVTALFVTSGFEQMILVLFGHVGSQQGQELEEGEKLAKALKLNLDTARKAA